MAIIAFRELERSGSASEKGQRTYTRQFTLDVDAGEDPQYIIESGSVPRVTESYVGTNGVDGATCKSVSVEVASRASKERITYRVTADYSTSSDGEQTDNPYSRPPELSWSLAEYEEALEWEVVSPPPLENGVFKPRKKAPKAKEVLNSAGVKFDPPVTVPRSRPVLTIVRNEPRVDPSIIARYANAINSDTFYGAGPAVAKIMSLAASFQVEGLYQFFRVAYEVQFNFNGWDKQTLDAGLSSKFIGETVTYRNGKRVTPRVNPILDGSGQPITESVPLDGNGQQLEEKGEKVYLTFRAYHRLPFAPLNLEYRT